MKNPFRYGGIVTGAYFADRSGEIKELQREMENINRVFLISPRRLGKTCLLHNLMLAPVLTEHAFAYIDLNAFPDLRSFASAITSLTTKALESNTEKVLKLFSGFKRLRPTLNLGPDGNVSAGLELGADDKDALAALVEGLSHADALAAAQKKTLVIIIDEFSDIKKYNGGTVEKAMRAEIQKHRHTGYIFSGSEQSMMLSMVRDRKRAFYKMGRIMSLEPIQQKTYENFISGWFEKGVYAISVENVRRIMHMGENVTYNVQRLCHTAWEMAVETKTIDAALIERLPMIIVKQDQPHYEMMWQTISPAQRSLLIALTQDPDALPFSREFQFRHKIGPSSSIKASLVSLIKKGVLLKTVREGKYRFADLFLPYWIRKIRELQ